MKRNKRVALLLAVMLIFSLVGCGDGGKKYSSEEIYANCKESVAEITAYDKKGEAFSLGSGFVISDDGLIVTNFHVIDDAYSIIVNLGGVKYGVEFIEKYDADIDIAVIKIIATGLKKLKISEDGYADGSVVYTLGSSEGLTLSFSNGVIASCEREIDGIKYIQHSAPISHGNSGGPLIDEYGRVIGVNTASLESGQNINFAVKIGEMNRLSNTSQLSMNDFYKKEGPYFETFIGDYTVAESEPNNRADTAQIIRVNGTTVNGSINRQYDIDYYRVSVGAGEKLNVLFVPEMEIDANGALCGLMDEEGKVIAVAIKTTIGGVTLRAMFYTNDSSVSKTFMVVILYDDDYLFKDTVCRYSLFFYSK